jgi:hypothetical protein
VDRGILFWSKLVIFFAVCSLVWVVASGSKLIPPHPVQVRLYDNSRDKQFLDALKSTPSLGARVIREDGQHHVTVELDRGAQILAGLCGAKVAVISLAMLLFLVVLRLSFQWVMVGGFLLFLGLSLLLSFGASWLGGGSSEIFDDRAQVLFYARNPLQVWVPIFIFGGLAIWQARRRYIRP